jgi:hypothetical protein
MDDPLLAAHGFVAGPGVGKPLDLGDMRMSLKASAQQTQGALSLFETEDMPGFAPPAHFTRIPPRRSTSSRVSTK